MEYCYHQALYRKLEGWEKANALLISGDENLSPESIKPHRFFLPYPRRNNITRLCLHDLVFACAAVIVSGEVGIEASDSQHSFAFNKRRGGEKILLWEEGIVSCYTGVFGEGTLSTYSHAQL